MKALFNLYKKNKSKTLTITDQALVSGANFFSSLIYARILGLESYGAFVLAWMIVLFASAIQQAFIFGPMLNIYASSTKKETYTSHLLFIQLGFSLASAVFIQGLLFIDSFTFHSGYLIGLSYILPCATFSYLTHDFFRKKFSIQGKIQSTLLLDAALNVCLFLFLFILFKLDMFNVQNLFLVISMSYFVTSIAGYFLDPATLDKHSIHPILKNHWALGKWLVATSVLQWLSGNYFILIAGNILGTKETGIIRIAQNIVGVMNILFIAIESYIGISSSMIYNKYGVSSLFLYLKNVTLKGLTVTSAICILIAVFAEQLIHLLYGGLYLEYAYVVKIFALFYILVFLAIPLRFAIRTLEHNHHIFIGYLISCIFSLATANTLVSRFGLYGVLAGIILTQLLTQLWYIFSLKKYFYEHYSFGTGKS